MSQSMPYPNYHILNMDQVRRRVQNRRPVRDGEESVAACFTPGPHELPKVEPKSAQPLELRSGEFPGRPPRPAQHGSALPPRGGSVSRSGRRRLCRARVSASSRKATRSAYAPPAGRGGLPARSARRSPGQPSRCGRGGTRSPRRELRHATRRLRRRRRAGRSPPDAGVRVDGTALLTNAEPPGHEEPSRRRA